MSVLYFVSSIFEHKELLIFFFIFKFLLLLYLARRYYLRNKHLKEILESEKTYRHLFDNSVTATLMSGTDGIILTANRQFEKLTGFHTDEIKGKKWSEIVNISNGSEKCAKQNPGFLHELNATSWQLSVVKSKTSSEICCHIHLQETENEYSVMSFIKNGGNNNSAAFN